MNHLLVRPYRAFTCGNDGEDKIFNFDESYLECFLRDVYNSSLTHDPIFAECQSEQLNFDAVIYTNELAIDPRYVGTVQEFDVQNVVRISKFRDS
jgi:hypothetical protein